MIIESITEESYLETTFLSKKIKVYIPKGNFMLVKDDRKIPKGFKFVKQGFNVEDRSA